jgi:ankyrin repeat protein
MKKARRRTDMGTSFNGVRIAWIVPLLLVATSASAGADLRLLEAAKKGDAAAVRSLLAQHADVNARQADGATALAWAANRDDLESADLLIRAGASANVANEYGATPLSLACAKGSIAMVEKLLKAGANPNTALLSGETALMTATETGSLPAVNLLLAHGADANAKEPKEGQTALMWAVAGKHADIAQALIEHGADVHARSRGGFTALLFAAQQGDTTSARTLLAAGADVNEKAPARSDAASKRVGEKAVPEVPSPLLLASASAQQEISLFLLDKGADPNAADARGFSALHYAALRRNNLELLKALLAHGANPNVRLSRNAPNTGGISEMTVAGSTPLLLAAAAGNTGAIRALASAGADLKIGTKENTTALMVAAGVGLFEDRKEEPQKAATEAVKLLVELGSDVNAAGEHGWTALHGAAYTGANATIQYLVDKGAKMDVMDSFGQTPLSIAEAVVTPGVLNDAYKRGRAFRKSTSELLLKLGATPVAASGVQSVEGALPADYSAVTTPDTE